MISSSDDMEFEEEELILHISSHDPVLLKMREHVAPPTCPKTCYLLTKTVVELNKTLYQM